MSAQTLSKSGQIQIADPDINSQVKIGWSINSDLPITWSGGELNEGIVEKLDGLFISAASGGSSSTVNWSYEVNSVDLNFLAENETIVVTYSVVIVDEKGDAEDQILP